MRAEEGAHPPSSGASKLAKPSGRIARIGLRWRLAGWVALVVLVFSVVTFVAVYSGTGTQLRRDIDGEISGEARDLAHALAAVKNDSPLQLRRTADRYISSRPFGASASLLFAIVPGAGVATNRREMFTQGRPDDGETLAEQAQENRLSRQLLVRRPGFSTLELPDVGDVRLIERTLPVAGKGPVTVGVGEPLASVTNAQMGVARAFILAGIITLAGALIASVLVGTRFSRPLRRMAAVAARVGAGDLAPRIEDPGSRAEEVTVLADAFNNMLDRLAEAFAGQRAFVADASHELRTPLTVIRGQLEVLADQLEPTGEEVRHVERLVSAEIARITRLVDDLLLLAKAERGQFLKIEPIDLASYVHELWDGMSPIAQRRFELGPLPQGTLMADPDRLAQALRNLIANAIEQTSEGSGLVRLQVDPSGSGRIRFTLQDDGPGIPPDQRELVFDRFHRTDEARDRASGGTGLGLAIVRAIAEAHEGSVSVHERPGGGASIELELPGFSTGVSAKGTPVGALPA